MMSDLKPVSIKAKVDHLDVNKVLVDSGAAVNLMPHSLVKIIGKFDTDLTPHDMVLFNYKGNTCHSLGAIRVDLAIGIRVRPTLFMVTSSKAN